MGLTWGSHSKRLLGKGPALRGPKCTYIVDCGIATVDDYILPYLEDPKLWELWYVPHYGEGRIYIIHCGLEP